MSTKQFLTIFSVSISLWIATSCVSSVKNHIVGEKTFFSLAPSTDSLSFKYRTLIQIDTVQLSGIILLKCFHDTIRGVFMNEFGLNAFNFFVTKNSAHISTNLDALNKWYIRKTLSHDLHFLLLPLYSYSNNQLVTTQKTKFGIYYYRKENQWITAQKAKHNKTKATMKIFLDGTVEMINLERNIIYKLTILAQTY